MTSRRSLVSEHAPVVIGLVGPDETVLALDGALVDQLGYRREDWVGRPVTDLVRTRRPVAVLRRALAGEHAARTTACSTAGPGWSPPRPVPRGRHARPAAVRC